MGVFRYEARDSRGQLVRGELEADSREDAERRLGEVGFLVRDIREQESDSRSAGRLSEREAELVVAQVADLSEGEMPLAPGLRAAAEGSSSARVSAALRRIAEDLDRGQTLEQSLQQRGALLPAHVRGLVAAALRTGRLGPALQELLEHQRTNREVVWGVLGSVAYPLLVLGCALLLFVLLPLFVVPLFKKTFEEFGLELPYLTQALIGLSDGLIWMTRGRGGVVVLGGLLLGAALIFGLRWLLGPAESRRIWNAFPLLGPLWCWSGAAAFSRLLAVLVKYGVPLPEALRLTGDGVRDANVRELCREFSVEVEQGRSLSELLTATPRLPASLAPLVRWGEKTGSLADALQSASDLFVGRIWLRASLLRSISPPLVFVVVFVVVGLMVVSLFLPLVSLIQGLS